MLALQRLFSERGRKSSNEEMIVGRSRSTSVSKAAAVAQINPDAPIVLFMGKCLFEF